MTLLYHKTFGNIFYIVTTEKGKQSALKYSVSYHMNNLNKIYALLLAFLVMPPLILRLRREITMKCVPVYMGQPLFSKRGLKHLMTVWGPPVVFLFLNQLRVDSHSHLEYTVCWPWLESNSFKAILLLTDAAGIKSRSHQKVNAEVRFFSLTHFFLFLDLELRI